MKVLIADMMLGRTCHVTNPCCTVAVVDYGMGNLLSVERACSHVGLRAVITSDKNSLSRFDGVILPGVGAFGSAIQALTELDLIDVLKGLVLEGKPFLGICLGLQLLFSESDESKNVKGLNIISGSVSRFPNEDNNGKTIKVPHIGWNQIYSTEHTDRSWNNTCLAKISSGEFMYFVHSYYVTPCDKGIVLSVSKYGDIQYCSSLSAGNVMAVQFHPEKSGQQGLRVYKNYADMVFSRKEEGWIR